LLPGRGGAQSMPSVLSRDTQRALRSLEVLDGVPADVLLPGHGEPWTEGAAEAARLARVAGPPSRPAPMLGAHRRRGGSGRGGAAGESGRPLLATGPDAGGAKPQRMKQGGSMSEAVVAASAAICIAVLGALLSYASTRRLD